MADADLLKDAVRQAGALALSHFRTDVERWTKSDGSPVTAADLAVDKLLRERLTAARPDYGWLS
ncbi:MAG: 3'(2'),5'-bisphosphate nucleotidase CysQ, partial [Parvibaculaceae bacterium]